MKVNEFINETASVGASAAGAIAAAPAAVGGMQRRKKKKQNDLDLTERHKPGNWVVITKGRYKGQEGTIGEIHNGPHSSAPKTYIIDLGGDFHNGSVQLKPGMFKAKRTVNEDFDELVQVEFNNERAMELAQQKFDFDWNGDNMYLDPQQVGRMEDLLVSSGFTEPDDFQIEPQNPYEDAVYEGNQFEVWLNQTMVESIDANNLPDALRKAKKKYGPEANVLPH